MSNVVVGKHWWRMLHPGTQSVTAGMPVKQSTMMICLIEIPIVMPGSFRNRCSEILKQTRKHIGKLRIKRKAIVCHWMNDLQL